SFPTGVKKGTGNLLSFHVYLLPYVGEGPRFAKFNLTQKYSSANNLALCLSAPPIYQCPIAEQRETQYGSGEWSGGVPTKTHHYCGCAGPLGTNPQTGQPYASLTTNQGNEAIQGVFLMGTKGIRMKEIIDGTSTTFALGELSWTKGNYYRVW